MTPAPSVVAFVGGGPRAVGLLERLAANADELLGAGPVKIHVVDPYPVGGGRIWRTEQSALLWMNSMARDITIFTDASVTCDGPIVPGPSLADWVRGDGAPVLQAAGLGEVATSLRPDDFASRQVQSHYLNWAYRQTLGRLPERVQVIEHRARAVDLTDSGRRQTLWLDNGTSLSADVVVLAQGYLDRRPSVDEDRLTAYAKHHALTYVPPGYTADVDLSALRPGQPVLVRGFGLAFIDLMVLLGEGRGGRFENNADGTLTYRPSGAEPVLHVGSRRGVPYHAKLGYSRVGAVPAAAQYFTPDAVAALGDADHPADFRRQIWPLVVKELAAAHYRELFTSHPERTLLSWAEFSAVFDQSDVTSETFQDVVAQAVPKREDRFDLAAIDRPFAEKHFGSTAELTESVVEYVRGDLRRRSDPYFSADAAVFDALLTVYMVLAMALTSGRISPADRIRSVEGEFHGLFSFLASGPPPRRLAELLALHDAGLVHFLGPELAIDVRDGHFVGSSPAGGDPVRARALVDARLPRPDVRAATDPIIRGLLSRGELAAEDLSLPNGTPLGGGQLLADAGCRAVRADRSVHLRRFLLGPSVSGSAGSAGFSRPGFNGPGFRQNDAVARDILQLLQSDRSDLDPAPPTDVSTINRIPLQKEIHHAR